jgi:ParB-like chromosome segregation protein Spo0J
MSARQHVASAALPSGSSVDAWTTPAVSPEHVYQTMPPLAQDDADALERSIRTHGIQTPIIVDEQGNIIDGHHRREIATRCGLPLPVEVRRDLDESTKIALSISLNVDRRQLTREQKREIIAASIKAEPTASNREHARRTGADDKTVGTIRDDLAARAEIPHVSERTDSLGRQQPASKPVVSIKHKTTEETTETFDAETGEAVESPARAFIEAAVASDQSVQDAAYMHSFYQALTRAHDFMTFDPTRVGRLSEQADLTTLDQLVDGVTKFRDKARLAGSGLRLVGGNK